MVAVEVLPATLVRLQRAHPRLQVELVATNRIEDLLNRESDIAVRMVRPAQQALLARRTGDIELGLFAHRGYLAGRTAPKRVLDLQAHALIGFDREDASARSLVALLGAVRRKSFSFRTDSHLASFAALRAGAGVGICQVPLARRHPELVRVLGKHVAPRLETWVTMHSDLRTSPRCRVTFDALVEDLTAYCRS
jgi:DNA-binding transcriptional LysR family regulator